ncbi:hypothetical protein RJ640_003713 [Escallonia rubra]|uniref:Uncharacterized protein n=1 Tax=Escallonia rubra TaxID=112253 RepID=A0AA88RXN1_9ASTE|nr:hypothetical protein RJ640_003713 [Escallonia rubra]
MAPLGNDASSPSKATIDTPSDLYIICILSPCFSRNSKFSYQGSTYDQYCNETLRHPPMAYLFPSRSTVTNEEFNMFHTIDRELFTRLILNLGRDPAESIQVMAFLLWLEKVGHGRNLVNKLLSWPLTLVNGLADECVACLKCAQTDEFFFREGDDLALLQSLTEIGLSLNYFHENRIGLVRGVTRIVTEICARAFNDILRQNFGNMFTNVPVLVAPHEDAGQVVPLEDNGSGHGPVLGVPFIPPIRFVPHLGFGGAENNAPNFLPTSEVHGIAPVKTVAFPSPALAFGSFHAYDLENQREVLNDELDEMLERISLTVSEEEKEVPSDDRTIFLTFSKGYPISESEVRDFFSRKFGDFIEDLYMQEVSPGDQALYARLVARSASVIDLVVDREEGKSKYSINGKHIWARKYVKKNTKSPPRKTSPPPQPTSSPAAAPQP